MSDYGKVDVLASFLDGIYSNLKRVINCISFTIYGFVNCRTFVHQSLSVGDCICVLKP